MISIFTSKIKYMRGFQGGGTWGTSWLCFDCLLKLTNSFSGLWKTRLTEDTEEDRELYVRTTLRELGVYIGFISILCIRKSPRESFIIARKVIEFVS